MESQAVNEGVVSVEIQVGGEDQPKRAE